MTKLARKLEELFLDMAFAEDRAFNPGVGSPEDGEALKCRWSGYRPKGFSKTCIGRAVVRVKGEKKWL